MVRFIAFAALFLVGAAPPQETPKSPPPCCDGKNPKPWADYNKGVKWSQPAVESVEKARRENKLLMVFQLVGDVDKEGC